MELDWTSSYKTITAKHDEAYKTIELAIKNEEQEQPQIALLNYKLGISLIDDALTTPISVPDEPSQRIDEEWDRACRLIHKMKRTRGEVVLRVGTLAQQHPSINDEPNRACGGETSTSGGRPRTYAELADALRSIEYTELDQQKKNQLDLIFACHGVKLYHISRTGECKTAAEDSILRIINIAEDVDKNIQSSFFLQIIMTSEAVDIGQTSHDNGTQQHVQISSEQLETLKAKMTSDDRSWIYPLVPGAAPCFRTTYGAFIFPDLQSDEPGSAYGIIVPAEADDMILQILESILHGVIIQSDDGSSDATGHRARRAASTSHVVSGNIVLGATYISRGLIKSSEKVGEFVGYSTPYIMSKLGRAPNDGVSVSPTVRNSVEMAKSATGIAANVAGYVAGKVGTATMALGRFLAPHVQTQGSRLLTHTMGYSDTEASEKVKILLLVVDAVHSETFENLLVISDERRIDHSGRCR